MSSHNIKKPNGGVTMRRVKDKPDPNENLLERILSWDNVQKAWKRVKANKGAPRIDGMSIDDFLEFARAHWDRIRESLLAGIYQPSPVKRVEIPKPTGGTRPLGIPVPRLQTSSSWEPLGKQPWTLGSAGKDHGDSPAPWQLKLECPINGSRSKD